MKARYMRILTEVVSLDSVATEAYRLTIRYASFKNPSIASRVTRFLVSGALRSFKSSLKVTVIFMAFNANRCPDGRVRRVKLLRLQKD